LALLLANSPLHVIVAVGHDGVWHLLSKLPETRRVPVPTALAAFRVTFQRVATPYLALARSGSMSREDALRDALHLLWQFLAPRLGLRYGGMIGVSSE
jgi:hypothetical protein